MLLKTSSGPDARAWPWTERLRRWGCSVEDRLFERLHGFDLGGTVPPAALAAPEDPLVAHATSYQAVWCRNVRTVMRMARQLNPDLRAFVDLGSGKGKACFYAALHGDFQQVIGVEFSWPLVSIARANQEKCRASSPVRFVHADAGGFELPDAPTLVFMFNPFDAVVLQRFLACNRDHFRRHQSLIGYANDAHADALAAAGFAAVYREDDRRLSLHRWFAH